MKNIHLELGKQLKLFIFPNNYGQNPIILPKGSIIIDCIKNFIETEEKKLGYEKIMTPLVSTETPFCISGHWDHYIEKIFYINESESRNKVFRPVTCPFHIAAYNAEIHSYKDLPIRFSETTHLFRKIQSGESHGLFRTCQIHISDGHIFCAENQVIDEINATIGLIKNIATKLGLLDSILWRFSRGESNNRQKYIGDEGLWKIAEEMIEKALKMAQIDYFEKKDVAAFYGPKIDILVKDSFCRDEALFTIQLDYQLASKFEAKYTDKDGTIKAPIIIHRTTMSSFERTLAVLLEKNLGNFPFWMAPLQLTILPISFEPSGKGLLNHLIQELDFLCIRYFIDKRDVPLGKKISDAKKENVPYIVFIGKKEIEKNCLTIKDRNNNDYNITIEEFITLIKSDYN